MKQKELMLGVIVIVSLVIALLTYDPHTETANPVLHLLVQLHAPLMFIMVLLAAVFGYFMNKSLESQISGQEKKSAINQQEMVQLLLQTLSSYEKSVLKELIEKPQTQAQLSKKLGRVQAHRTIKKLADKQLIRTQNKGKTILVKAHPLLEKR